MSWLATLGDRVLMLAPVSLMGTAVQVAVCYEGPLGVVSPVLCGGDGLR